ncbi:GyrI-like domain-containing protein [Mucilaginibacter sp.]|uniref:GyrI-like domain-containing protein n=1 Tax=Mucilaginibacter sp. TaxID=1882438 RepID=UPI002ED37832
MEGTVQIITLNDPIKLVGKVFTGSYSDASLYVTAVQNELTAAQIPFIPYKICGIYYDDPQVTPAAEQRSFQGVVTEGNTDLSATLLTAIDIAGQFLYTKVTGDPMQSIMKGYGDLFAYIQAHQTKLKSNAGYQVLTFTEGQVITEIYMEL